MSFVPGWVRSCGEHKHGQNIDSAINNAELSKGRRHETEPSPGRDVKVWQGSRESAGQSFVFK